MSTFDPTDQVLALLIEARKSGWQIALKMQGDFEARARFEITIWREPPPPSNNPKGEEP